MKHNCVYENDNRKNKDFNLSKNTNPDSRGKVGDGWFKLPFLMLFPE